MINPHSFENMEFMRVLFISMIQMSHVYKPIPASFAPSGHIKISPRIVFVVTPMVQETIFFASISLKYLTKER
jgi:hypothetical protein